MSTRQEFEAQLEILKNTNKNIDESNSSIRSIRDDLNNGFKINNEAFGNGELNSIEEYLTQVKSDNDWLIRFTEDCINNLG